MKKIDILSIGNITQDINIVGKKKYYSLGGTSFYAYKVSEKLGFDLGIISEVSNKIDYEKYIDIKKLIFQKTENHTIFENNYVSGLRYQKVINKPGKILVNNLSNSLASIIPKIVFYCPILNEIENKFFNLFDKSFKVCNLQGFVRKVSKDKIKLINKLPDINFKNFDAVILSEMDASFENALKIATSSKIVCYTMGNKGVKIISNGNIRHIDTIKIKYIDETGAGDVWGASFIIFYYLMKKDLYESAYLSNISASLSVEGYSDNKISTYNKILSYR
ncbi:MAG: PfkB family carbohydrate kinase [Dehalococcoidia bacterium]